MSCYLFVSYSGVLGGAERVLLDAARSLDGKAVLACPDGPLAEAAADLTLTTIILPGRDLRARDGIRRRLRAGINLSAHAWELRRLARDLRPDLVVSWGMRSGIAALALPPTTPLAFEHHDFLPGPGLAKLVRRVVERAQLVTVPSHAVGVDLALAGRTGTPIRIIAPGIEPSDFSALSAPPVEPSVLLLGALTRWKHPELALEIIALARTRMPGITLRVVGGPPTEDDALIRELHDRAGRPDLRGAVALVGPVDDPRPELERACCLLHCASAEPFGLVLVEALAAGRPVVAPDSAGPREIVDATCGERYSAGDAQAGAAALVRLLEDPNRLREMGAAGRRRVLARFTAARTRREYRDALLGSPEPAAEAANARDVTLVTVTFNSAAELTRLIASRDAHLPGTPLIVVDSASSDDSVAVARGASHVEVIALETNVGFGTACNRGLRRVRTPVTMLVNPDVELIDDSILELVREVSRSTAPERLLSPLVLNGDGSRQDTAHPAPCSMADLVRALVPPALVRVPYLAPWRARRPRRVGWAVGAALVARTTTLTRLGPFDESIFMYGEDMDLGLKATAASISTWFWPSARVVHLGAHSTDQQFGGEAFELLAQARWDTVRRQLGLRRAYVDAGSQTVALIWRIALKTALRRSAERERRQLAAVRGRARR